jgi:hypothetical protein
MIADERMEEADRQMQFLAAFFTVRDGCVPGPRQRFREAKIGAQVVGRRLKVHGLKLRDDRLLQPNYFYSLCIQKWQLVVQAKAAAPLKPEA